MANPILGGIFKNPMIEQIFVWQVLQGLVNALEAPLIAEIQQTSFEKFPSVVSSPIELAAGVIRGHIDPAHAAEEAKKSGYDKEPFQLLLDNGGEPPGLEFLLAAYRRGFIERTGSGAASTSLEQGIRESQLKNKWVPLVEQMRVQPISVGEAINAWVRGQITEAEAKKIAYQNGIDDAGATILYHSTGRPPSPMELVELYRRGYIPLEGTGPGAVSFQQGIYEGDSKNKWWSQLGKLAEYLPPPRTITAMIREGALTDEEGATLLHRSGLSPHLVERYMLAAHHQKTAATRELAKGDILAGYSDRLIDHARALVLLEALGWHAADAEFELALADFRRDHALVTGAVTRIKGAYIARKVTRQAALADLGKLGVGTEQVNHLFAVWDIERAGKVERLPAAEWASAAFYGIVTPEEAIAQLEALGYSPFEAWVRISVRMHGPATATPPASDIPAGYTR